MLPCRRSTILTKLCGSMLEMSVITSSSSDVAVKSMNGIVRGNWLESARCAL